MRIKERSFVFVSFLLIVQAIFLHRFNQLEVPLLFLEGVPVSMQSSIMYQLLTYWYIPVVGMSFYFSGRVHDHLVGYGQLILIRNYSKNKWMIQLYGRLYLFIFIFVFLEICFSWISKQGLATVFARPSLLVQQIVAYSLTLIVLFSIQMFLELYLPAQVAQLIINLYIIFTILMTYYNESLNGWTVFNYFGIPNYGMGLRTGTTALNEFGRSLVPLTNGTAILIAIELCILYLSARRIKFMDIM